MKAKERGRGGSIRRVEATARGAAAAMCSGVGGNMQHRRALDGLGVSI